MKVTTADQLAFFIIVGTAPWIFVAWLISAGYA